MAEHSISIYKDKSVVHLKISSDVTTSSSEEIVLDFTLEQNDEFDAELLVRYLRKRHGDQMEEIRKAEFFSGWRMAKAKKRGKKFFRFFSGSMKKEATHRYLR